MLKGESAPEIVDVPMVNKKWTPVDSFVTEYGFRHDQAFTYQPGSGAATMKTGYMDLDDLRALIKSVEHHELQIMISGDITIFQPEEPGEEAEAPEEEKHETKPYEPLVPDDQEPEEEVAEAIIPDLEEGVEIIVEEEKSVEELIPA